ncbi:uncharacterized protein PAC_15529 [Phialocephala subalpina]|uniref:EKC/KEOPS complex subunit BUD32 n=1 Tax=Phialocephala subalpina TaxID=576137 RepID=A0A1L7XKR1_9HELO|nr:uncharacterized protein PAC_15529 [Phialocephala subalpina]
MEENTPCKKYVVGEEAMEYDMIHKDAEGWHVGYLMTPMRTYLEEYRRGERVHWREEGKQFFTWKGPEAMAPLKYIQHLGGVHDRALVERVQCKLCNKRTVLARKLVNCRNEDILERTKHALQEINVLINLRHPHIVAFVDAYYLDGDGNENASKIGILLYPAAEWNLKQFMEAYEPTQNDEEARTISRQIHNQKMYHLRRFFACLSQALDFLHKNVRHKDITPYNVLVDSFGNVLISDFGLSRSFTNAKECYTDTEKFTSPEYSSPEFAEGRERGKESDIFGLGLVFAEMATVVMNRSLEAFKQYRNNSDENEGYAYFNNPNAVKDWLEKELRSSGEPGQQEMENAIPSILKMISYQENLRPVSRELHGLFGNISPIKCPDCHPGSATVWNPDTSPMSEDDQRRFEIWKKGNSTEFLAANALAVTSARTDDQLIEGSPGTFQNDQRQPDRQDSGSTENGSASSKGSRSRQKQEQPPNNVVITSGRGKMIVFDVEKPDKIQYVSWEEIKRRKSLPQIMHNLLTFNRQKSNSEKTSQRCPKIHPSLRRRRSRHVYCRGKSAAATNEGNDKKTLGRPAIYKYIEHATCRS